MHGLKVSRIERCRNQVIVRVTLVLHRVEGVPRHAARHELAVSLIDHSLHLLEFSLQLRDDLDLFLILDDLLLKLCVQRLEVGHLPLQVLHVIAGVLSLHVGGALADGELADLFFLLGLFLLLLSLAVNFLNSR